MRFYTSFYGNYRKFPKDALLVSISLSKPKGYVTDIVLSWLAPNWSMLQEYKKTQNKELYNQKYTAILHNQFEKLADFIYWAKAQSQDVIFLCWEGKTKFCHRHLLAEYISCFFEEDVTEL